MYNKSGFRMAVVILLFAVILSLFPAIGLAAEPTKMILATTTSTDDSGLLDNILPDFEQKYNADVEVVAVGTGQALKLGQDCNADVVLVHSRTQEDKFIADGFGINRQDVMYNDFIILGPPSDPAGIKGMTSAADAFKKIAETGNKFISRGDESGTHTKEKAVWKAAGIEPAGDWYVSTGLGMGEVLTMANEQLAYTLADRGTYLARTLEGTDLVVVVEGDKVLFNPYGVIAVNPAKCPNVKTDMADGFINWIISLETQKLISDFKVADQSLFVPDSVELDATYEVVVTIGDKSKTFTLDELKTMPKVTLENIEFIGHKKGPLGANTWTGASLKDMLLAVDPTISDPTNAGKLIIATASDGWVSKLRWNQVFGQPKGGEALADSYGCTECHGMQGEGDEKRDTPELVNKTFGPMMLAAVIREPGSHGKINPFTPEQLSDEQLKVIMDWFRDMNAPSEGFEVPESSNVTLLAYEMDGQPITGKDGLIQMVMGMDKYTSRFAHWVKTITVE